EMVAGHRPGNKPSWLDHLRQTDVVGYSAAQANQRTCVPSSQVSVQPFNFPSTARPAMSQRDLVSRSTNGAAPPLQNSSEGLQHQGEPFLRVSPCPALPRNR